VRAREPAETVLVFSARLEVQTFHTSGFSSPSDFFPVLGKQPYSHFPIQWQVPHPLAFKLLVNFLVLSYCDGGAAVCLQQVNAFLL
jgi:hypothetical protein